MVAGEAGALTKPQFYSTLRLISLAQASGGDLPEAAARSALVGIGPALPAPALHTLAGHGGKVCAVAWAGPGRLVSGGEDGRVRAWDVQGVV